jgi:hypothetical protein
MKMQTKELTGKPLDWALAVAMGCTAIRQQHTRTLDGPVQIDARDPDGFFIRVDHTDPATCLGLTSKINIMQQATDGTWRVAGRRHDGCHQIHSHGSTLPEAVARCVVAMRLGDEVEVPDELAGVQS